MAGTCPWVHSLDSEHPKMVSLNFDLLRLLKQNKDYDFDRLLQ